MSLYQKEYPQIYPAREIVEALAYPKAPLEPKEPKPIDEIPPSKYPNLKENFQIFGIGLCAFAITLIICFYVTTPFFILLALAFALTAIVGIFKIIKSLRLKSTYKDRLSAYNEAIQSYDKALADYKVHKATYEIDKSRYEELCSSLKTQEDILNYRLNQRNIFLKETKSKKRHEWFFDRDELPNPKLGRAEYFFRDFIHNQNIPIGYDFFFDTSVEVSSYSINSKVSFFHPDLLVLTPRGLMIDVEIDEPYSADSHKPIHCVHSLQNGDFSRNQYFTKFNCSVLRFSERQIIKYPEICLNIILSFDDYASIPPNLVLPNDFKESTWDEQTAIRLAAENYRDSY